MKPDAESVMDSLARFVLVIGKDRALRQRFCELAGLSAVQRSNEIHIMAEQMAAERKDPELVNIFRLFADPRVFEAGMVALRESGQESQPSREAQFSEALWKLEKDWNEPREVQPHKKFLKHLLIFLAVTLLYGLSAGPVIAMLKATLPQTAVAPVCRSLYYPHFFLIEHDTPLAAPVRAYLSLWGAT